MDVVVDDVVVVPVIVDDLLVTPDVVALIVDVVDVVGSFFAPMNPACGTNLTFEP